MRSQQAYASPDSTPDLASYDGYASAYQEADAMADAAPDCQADQTSKPWRWPWFFSIQGEVGLDAGGVGREVLRLATNDLCSLDLGLFRHATDDAMTYALRDGLSIQSDLHKH